MNGYQEQLNRVITSKEISEKVFALGDKHNLLIDQVGELGAEIRDTITGITSARDFVNNLKERLEISDEKARAIAQDAQDEIINEIKETLQKLQDEVGDQSSVATPIPPISSTPSNLSSLEKAGDFEIVKDKPAPSSVKYEESSFNRNKLLNDIENPPSKVSFVDHLLANPVTNQNKVVETPKPVAQTPPPQPPSNTSGKPSLDPYREPIE